MHTKSIKALGHIPESVFWNSMSHFGLNTINEKSSIASRGLRDVEPFLRLESAQHTAQVFWGSGNYLLDTGVPISSFHGIEFLYQPPQHQFTQRTGENSQSIFQAKNSTDFMVCPVCGKKLAENLPDGETMLSDLWYVTRDKIINSRIFIEHQFSHYYDEENDCVMEDPHVLKAVISVEFNAQGNCTDFTVVAVYPGE